MKVFQVLAVLSFTTITGTLAAPIGTPSTSPASSSTTDPWLPSNPATNGTAADAWLPGAPAANGTGNGTHGLDPWLPGNPPANNTKEPGQWLPGTPIANGTGNDTESLVFWLPGTPGSDEATPSPSQISVAAANLVATKTSSNEAQTSKDYDSAVFWFTKKSGSGGVGDSPSPSSAAATSLVGTLIPHSANSTVSAEATESPDDSMSRGPGKICGDRFFCHY